MVHINSDPKAMIDEGLIRHVVLNSLRSYVKQFKSKYGSFVICCDSRKYWRRDVFPFYKANRKKDRQASKFDWTLIFDTLNKIRDEIKNNFPYRVIEVEGAEAYDVIAVLAGRFASSEDILILSSDEDFVQLQKYKNVHQYSPSVKRFLKTDNPRLFLKEHVLRGDRGDGVPNFLSADNTLVTKERQKNINKVKLQEWLHLDPEAFCTSDVMKRGYARNKLLIDLDCIPAELQKRIVETYDDSKPKSRTDMLNYLISNKLKALVEVADEF
jgi:hypothetical protein